ncbi:hypothetical protein R3P82_13520 [Dietzia maris]|uniref:Uncharacterized protein n=1 Tax=Dietzia maris TaxID=37915 RepID=A0AAE4QZN1_9ACTN|nr:hypothetical protein [Dietzia maris]MDV6300123.1 hypothetical protein [Dietzia maris]
MRVSTDGTFHGLRASHLCRAACRVPVDPGPFNRRLLALHPVINYRPYITASPDVFPPGHPGYDQGVAADLQIPQALRNEIEDWIDQFKTHFRHLGDRPVDQPVWTNGFDEMDWLDRGHALAERLGQHFPEHFVFCCAEQYVVCELAADQLGYVCAVTGQFRREHGWRMPGNEPDPDVPGTLKLMPEYGVEWGLWDGWLPYHQPPRLRTGPGPGGFPTPRSLGLTSQLEDRLRQWNEEWHRGFLGYGRDDDGASADLGLPNGGFALPEWADDVDPVAWYREGHAIAASLADQLPGVTVRLRAIRYVCAPRFLHLTKVFGDDEFFTPLSRRRSIMATATGYD